MQYQNSKILAVIPARLKSERFPNKLLQTLKGEVILKRVYDNIVNSGITENIIVATDSKEIVDFCTKHGVATFYMEDEVSCGSERLWYVSREYPEYDYYLSFAADEALIDPLEIKNMWIDYQVIKKIHRYDIYTCGSKFYNHQRIPSFNSCKIVTNKDDRVLFFSRSPIPLSKGGLLHPDKYTKHVGIFVFTKSLLKVIDKPSRLWGEPLSRTQGLEQTSFLENNFTVGIIRINHRYYGVDTIEDLNALEEMI